MAKSREIYRKTEKTAKKRKKFAENLKKKVQMFDI